MSNTYTGTGGASGLEVRTFDLATDLFGIDIIEVSNGSLTVGSSPNIAVINTGGGGGGGVTTIAFGTTGLTPAAATAGGVTVAGTLVAANGGTSFSTYAQGDIIYASAVNTLAKLTKGAAGQVLTMNGGATIPEWAAPTGGIGGTIADTQVAYGTAADTIGGEAELTYVDTAGSRKFTVSDSDAGTTTVLYPLKVSRISTGTAAVGLGVGLEFEAEAPAQAGVNVVGSILESISTAGTTAANTRFDLVIKNHNGSGDPALTNEVARFTSTGGFTTTSSVAAGTTVIVDPGAGGTVTVGGSGGVVVDGTGGVSTVNGAISAGGATGAVTANTSIGAGTTVTGGTGVIATTGGVLASAGGVTATLGNITATAGNIGATAGSVSAATTVTGGTGVTATTGNVSATAGAVLAGTSVNATTNVTAGQTVTGATGVVATTGGVLASAGGVTATLGNITATAGNIGATAGSVSAGTTVTGATGVIATAGGVSALGTGQITTVNGPISAGGAFGTVVGAAGVIATTGGVTAVAGGVTATAGDVTAAAGNILATIGYSSQIGGQIFDPTGAPAGPGADLSDGTYFGGVTTLAADTYTLTTAGSAGATATFITPNALATVAVAGGVVSVTGGGATGTAFTCPQFDSFTIYFTSANEVYVFGNVTVS